MSNFDAPEEKAKLYVLEDAHALARLGWTAWRLGGEERMRAEIRTVVDEADASDWWAVNRNAIYRRSALPKAPPPAGMTAEYWRCWAEAAAALANKTKRAREGAGGCDDP